MTRPPMDPVHILGVGASALEEAPDDARPVPDDALREQYAAAIRDAACTGDCNMTEEECARTRIQPVVWHHGCLAEVSGTPEMLADAVLAVRDREMEQLRTELAAAQRELTTSETARAHLRAVRDRLAAAITRVTAAVHVADDEDVTVWQRGYRACTDRVLAALDGPAAKPHPAEAERDQAYRERAHLLAWLAALHPANAVITPAPDIDEPGWQLLYLLVGGWQMSWHIHPHDAALFAHVEHVDPDDPRAQWDGHSTTEKYERIQEHTRRLNQADTGGRRP
ncbi:hypothetical protein AB0H03_06625 [Streptomyces sparsogenes]|uniref:hypothetical protein n=1 Tax=Streptomyces sparsogenes TaxID=67365 RepID=UPI0033DA3C39